MCGKFIKEEVYILSWLWICGVLFHTCVAPLLQWLKIFEVAFVKKIWCYILYLVFIVVSVLGTFRKILWVVKFFLKNTMCGLF